jgi:uncharacterized protein YggT (Ycf19 family)
MSTVPPNVPPDDDTVDRREETVIREHGVAPPVVPPVQATPVTETTHVHTTPTTDATVVHTTPVVPSTPVITPGSVQAEHVSVDYGAERRAMIHRTNQVISFIFGLFIALILIRVLLRLIAADPRAGFAQFIYGLTNPLVAPFVGLTGTPAFEGSVLEIHSLIAAIVYALLAWALMKLVWLIWYRPTTSEVSSTTYRRD